MIQLENIIKKYGSRGQSLTAFGCERLSINNGEYVAVVGPSGSGKTTLLSLLGGMLSPSAGHVRLDGISLYEQSVAARSAIRSGQMGFVFQSFNLIPYLSALQNVQVPLSLSGVPSTQQVEQATTILEHLGLAQRLHHRPAELSVGQQQRVALARTLVNNPQIILADEPTGNLDPASREIVLRAFDECHQQGRTLVVVTHDPSVAQRATRQLTLVDGQLLEAPAERRLSAQCLGHQEQGIKDVSNPNMRSTRFPDDRRLPRPWLLPAYGFVDGSDRTVSS